MLLSGGRFTEEEEEEARGVFYGGGGGERGGGGGVIGGGKKPDVMCGIMMQRTEAELECEGQRRPQSEVSLVG